MSNPDITWTATVALDAEDGVLDVTITKDVRAGISGPFVAFQLGKETPLTGYGRGVEYALRQHGFNVTDGWTVVHAATGMWLTADLERRDGDDQATPEHGTPTATLDPETLTVLAHAAEWMAENSEASDRGGRCSAHLHAAARQARAAAAR